MKGCGGRANEGCSGVAKDRISIIHLLEELNVGHCINVVIGLFIKLQKVRLLL